MRRKGLHYVLVTALALSTLAAPAIAEDPERHLGLLEGYLSTGYYRDGCAEDGTSQVWNDGSSYYGRQNYFEIGNAAGTHEPVASNLLSEGAAYDLLEEGWIPFNGTWRMCGRLGYDYSNPGWGCRIWDGKGFIQYPGEERIWLQNIRGYGDVMGSQPLIGEAVTATGVRRYFSVTFLDFSGWCVYSSYAASGLYRIDEVNQSDMPITCEEGLENGCWYEAYPPN